MLKDTQTDKHGSFLSPMRSKRLRYRSANEAKEQQQEARKALAAILKAILFLGRQTGLKEAFGKLLLKGSDELQRFAGLDSFQG